MMIQKEILQISSLKKIRSLSTHPFPMLYPLPRGLNVKLIKPDGDLNQKLVFVKLPNAHDSHTCGKVTWPTGHQHRTASSTAGSCFNVVCSGWRFSESQAKIILPWKNTIEKDHDQRMLFQVKVCDGYDLWTYHFEVIHLVSKNKWVNFIYFT